MVKTRSELKRERELNQEEENNKKQKLNDSVLSSNEDSDSEIEIQNPVDDTEDSDAEELEYETEKSKFLRSRSGSEVIEISEEEISNLIDEEDMLNNEGGEIVVGWSTLQKILDKTDPEVSKTLKGVMETVDFDSRTETTPEDKR